MGCDNVIFRKGKKPKSGRRHAADPYAETQSAEPTEARLDKPGPYDGDEVDTDTSRTGRVDFGSLQVRPMPGTQVLVRWERDIPRALVVRDQRSVVELQAFAAPRNGGLWDDLRQEMASGATKSGGMVSERRGPYGIELEITMPAQTQDGRHGTATSCLIGIDGPRWFLRGQVWGAAAKDPEAARPLLATLSDLVVVRGRAPMAPREFLPLSVPEELQQARQAQEAQEGQAQTPQQTPVAQQPQRHQAQTQQSGGAARPQPGPGESGRGQSGRSAQGGQQGPRPDGPGPQARGGQVPAAPAPQGGQPATREPQHGSWRPGQPDPAGAPGQQNQLGQQGRPGQAAQPGPFGHSGQPGQPGQPGRPGESGPQGQPGPQQPGRIPPR